MEHERIYALFKNFEDAASAIQELTRNGYNADYLSVVTSDNEGRFAHYVDPDHVHVEGDEGAGFGAVAGTLVGLAALAIPGVGPVVAAGPIATALTGAVTGAVAGAATGGLVGTLIDWGTNEEDAKRYKEILVDGGALLIASTYTEEWEDKVEAIFRKHHAMDVQDYDIS